MIVVNKGQISVVLTVIMGRWRAGAGSRRAGCGHFPLLGVAGPATARAPAL